VDQLVEAGAEIIAIDCTDQVRGDGSTIEEFIQAVRAKYPDQLLMADISTYEEGVRAWQLGMDLVGTTMSGYTPQSPQLDGPDYTLVCRLQDTLPIPVIGEGRVHTPEQAVEMLKNGAWAVVVGGAITRPLEIAGRFIKAIQNENNKEEA
jgi:N-acylglucosamine-6-phosphate 2-epimerase